jgi:NnrU protein
MIADSGNAEGKKVTSLFAAALFFDGIHFLISGTALRGKIVGLIGERPFQGLFSLMSLIGIVWLSRAYGQAEYVELWGKLQALRPFALIVMLVAFFFVVLAFTSPNPTAVGGGALLTEKEPAKGIQRITPASFPLGRRSLVLYSSRTQRRSRLADFLRQFSDSGRSGTFFDRSKKEESFRRCMESICRRDLQCALYSNHRGSQLAKGRRAGMVACGSGLGRLRFVSLPSSNSFRCLAAADVVRKIKVDQVGLSLPTWQRCVYGDMAWHGRWFGTAL